MVLWSCWGSVVEVLLGPGWQSLAAALAVVGLVGLVLPASEFLVVVAAVVGEAE